jgi:hypothetical protein
MNPNEYSNLDRLITKTQELTTMDELQSNSAMLHGLRVTLTHESTNQHETHIYVPSLSSLYLSWDSGFVEYHE